MSSAHSRVAAIWNPDSEGSAGDSSRQYRLRILWDLRKRSRRFGEMRRRLSMGRAVDKIDLFEAAHYGYSPALCPSSAVEMS